MPAKQFPLLLATYYLPARLNVIALGGLLASVFLFGLAYTISIYYMFRASRKIPVFDSIRS